MAKRSILALAVVLSAAVPVRAAYNAWTSHGPEGGQITAIAVDPAHPTTVYAGTAFAGVFRSDDGGKSWTIVSNGLTDLHVHALAERSGKLLPIAVPASTNGSSSASAVQIHQDASIYTSLLAPGDSTTHNLAEGRRA